MDDDTCIAVAVLHGAFFHKWVTEREGWGCWLPNTPDGDLQWTVTAGRSRADAARKYCERHNLMKVTSDE